MAGALHLDAYKQFVADLVKARHTILYFVGIEAGKFVNRQQSPSHIIHKEALGDHRYGLRLFISNFVDFTEHNIEQNENCNSGSQSSCNELLEK